MAPSVFIADAFGCRLRNTVTESQSDIILIYFLLFFPNLKKKIPQKIRSIFATKKTTEM